MAKANNANAESESSDNIHNGQDYRSLLHPKYMAHFGLRTTPQKFDEMVDWHLKFFGGRLVLKSAEAAMIAYDDEHHRLVIVKAPDHEATGNKKAMCGFYRIAFAFESLADLVTAYEQKKALGILPHWPVNHGMSTSLYYSDPDGNEFEINVDNFDTAAEAHAFMQTDEYLQNPIGVDFDAEVLVQRVRSGEDETSIKKRPVIGKRLNRWENSMYFKPENRYSSRESMDGGQFIRGPGRPHCYASVVLVIASRTPLLWNRPTFKDWMTARPECYFDHELVAKWQDDLLPNVIDRLARERPNAVYGEWVAQSSIASITYADLSNVINGLAHWLVEELGGLGRYGTDPEVLAYIGPNDVRYSALVFAAIKTGYVLFVTSPRNSPKAHQALFDHLQYQTLITSDPVPPAAQSVLGSVKPARHFVIPSVEDLLNKVHPLYEFKKNFQELRYSPFVIMHTSGTTGLPKPIIWTHETCNQVLNAKSQKPPNGSLSVDGSLINGKRVIITLPPFHGACLAQLVVGAVPYGNVVIAPVASPIPTAQGVVDALKQSPVEVAILVPSVVAELANSPDLLDYCAQHLETIIYIGGDLPKDIGNRIAAKVHLRCQWGQTETGIVPQLLSPELLPSEDSRRELWQYVKFHPCVGVTFDEVTDGNFEMVIKRDQTLCETQPCFTVPGLDALETEYRTKDLFKPHPSIADLWCWQARADDIIVFLNGEKTNPISMEQHVMSRNPELSGVLVIGAQRFQAALLIEPAVEIDLTTSEQAALIERIWPSVEEANTSAPAHARIEKAFILVVPADRRLIRSGKGTFMRGSSISQYPKEIESLYSNADVGAGVSGDNSRHEILYKPSLIEATRLVRHHVASIVGSLSIGDSDNFFDRGMDSLQGLQLTRVLRRTLSQQDIALSTIYENPFVAQLANAIIARDNVNEYEGDLMKNLLDTYVGLVQTIPVPSAVEDENNATTQSVNILLTGSTVAVGAQLLHALLDRDGIGHIFCLNRGDDGGAAAQYKSSAAAELTGTDVESRVTFIKADLQQPSLGLDEATSHSLQSQVHLVIHAAWPVNFNMPLIAFRPQLAGLVNLMAWTAHTGLATRFVFLSSIAAVEGYKNGPPPEMVLQDLDTPAPLGYGRAKFLAEILVDAAARHLGNAMPASIVRIGQVAGRVRRRGLWNSKEWFPNMVMTSLHLGMVPETLGPRFDSVDFVPMDILADVLTDLAMEPRTQLRETRGASVYNVRNPHLTPWATLLPAIAIAGRPGDLKPLEAVSPATWLTNLRTRMEVEDDESIAIKYPAGKLIGFFSKLWSEETSTSDARAANHSQAMVVEKALLSSPALRSLEPVNFESMRKWVDEWVQFQRKGATNSTID